MVTFWGKCTISLQLFKVLKINLTPGVSGKILFYFVSFLLISWVLVHSSLPRVPVTVKSVLYIFFYVIFMATFLVRHYLLLSPLYG